MSNEVEVTAQLVLLSESLKLTSELFVSLIEKHQYIPENMENAYGFMFGIKTSAEALTNMMKNQVALVQASNELESL